MLNGQLLPIPAALTEAEEFKRVKQQFKILLCVLGHAQAMDRAVIKWSCFSAVHAGEVVPVLFHRGIQRLACRQMATAHHPLLLQLSQVAVHRGQTHGAFRHLRKPIELISE